MILLIIALMVCCILVAIAGVVAAIEGGEVAVLFIAFAIALAFVIVVLSLAINNVST